MMQQRAAISEAHAKSRASVLPELRRFQKRRQGLVDQVYRYNSELGDTSLVERCNGVNTLSETKILLGGSPQKRCVVPCTANLRWQQPRAVLTSRLSVSRVLQCGSEFENSSETFANTPAAVAALLGLNGQGCDCALMGGFVVKRVFDREDTSVQDLSGRPTVVPSRALIATSMEYPHSFLFKLFGSCLEHYENRLFIKGSRFHRVSGGRLSLGFKQGGIPRRQWDNLRYQIVHAEGLEVLERWEVPSYLPDRKALDVQSEVYLPRFGISSEACSKFFAPETRLSAAHAPTSSTLPTTPAPPKHGVFGGKAAKLAPKLIVTSAGASFVRPSTGDNKDKAVFGSMSFPSTESVSRTPRVVQSVKQFDDDLRRALEASRREMRVKSPSEDGKSDLDEKADTSISPQLLQELHRVARPSPSLDPDAGTEGIVVLNASPVGTLTKVENSGLVASGGGKHGVLVASPLLQEETADSKGETSLGRSGSEPSMPPDLQSPTTKPRRAFLTLDALDARKSAGSEKEITGPTLPLAPRLPTAPTAPFGVPKVLGKVKFTEQKSAEVATAESAGMTTVPLEMVTPQGPVETPKGPVKKPTGSKGTVKKATGSESKRKRVSRKSPAIKRRKKGGDEEWTPG